MKILIAGAGDIGIHLCKMLQNVQHQVSLIDNREERLKIAASVFDGHTYKGNAASIDILNKANAGNFDLFISVTNNEYANITACILAKRIGAKKCLCRIDNIEFLEEDKFREFKELGIDYMFFPEQIAANEIVNLIEQSVQSDTMNFGGGKLVLKVLRIDEHSPALGQSIDEIYNISQSLEFKIAGIVRNNTTLIAGLKEIIQLNDLLYIIATQRGVQLLLKYLKTKTENINTVMILGGSRIGIHTARKLAQNHIVKIIERDRTKSFEISNALPGVLVINGDGRNIDLLMQEGISNTDAFISVTGDAEVNMIACLLAKRMGVKKTIAEIENMDYIRLAENIEIDSVINKKVLSASKIFSFTMNDDVSSVNCLTCSNAEILEYIAKTESKITLKPLKDIGFPAEAVIAGILRGNEAIIPDDNFQIKPFDKIVVFALPTAIKDIGKYFKSDNRFF